MIDDIYTLVEGMTPSPCLASLLYPNSMLNTTVNVTSNATVDNSTGTSIETGITGTTGGSSTGGV